MHTDKQQNASGGFWNLTSKETVSYAEMMTKMIPSKFGPIHNTIHIAKAQEDGVGGGEH